MTSLLLSLPDDLALRFRAAVPARSRSRFVADLLAREIDRHENALYKTALAVESDSSLAEEMRDWDVTTGDGLDAAR